MEGSVRIGIIGCGRVGSALAKAFSARGVPISYLYSRTPERASRLAGETGATALGTPQELSSVRADLWILAVNDDSIESAAAMIAGGNDALLVHTSGSFQTAKLSTHTNRFGVLYPLQTFSEGREVDLDVVPFFCSTSSEDDQVLLHTLAGRISKHVYKVDETDRPLLHLAAVFINNFTNALAAMSQELLKARSIPFHLYWPLLDETVQKLKALTPDQAQTGPAVRNDLHTIERHRAMLTQFPPYIGDVYELMTGYIRQQHKKHN